MQLIDKIAIINGGGSGIGAATCLAFAAAGANVVVAGRTLSKVQTVADQVQAGGGKALAEAVDVSQGMDVGRLMATRVAQFSGLDILLNNAGISPAGRITRVREEE